MFINGNSPISVVLLGSEGAGKTEIGHVLGNEPRIDFSSTKGVRVYNVQSKNQEIKLTEIGGSDSVRGIWPHYYNDVRPLSCRSFIYPSILKNV